MVDPFEEINFLTRSENRVAVLTTLVEETYTEREVVAETGISDVTVGRILDDFAERGWISEEDGVYRATRIGELLAADYGRLEESMDLACRLGPVRQYLPIEEMDFDLRLLADGLVSDPETFDALRAVDRWKQLVREADRIVGLAPTANAATVVADPFREEITAGDLEFETVVSAGYYETARERPEMRELLREILKAGAKMYLVPDEDDFGFTAATFDETAAITGYDDRGDLRVGIESRAAPVREWVRTTYEDYRTDARPLAPEDFVV